MDYRQIDEIHNIIHKTGIVDQVVKTINTETISPDQTLMHVITQIIIEIFHTETLDIDTTQRIDQETLQTTVIEIRKKIKKKFFQTKDQKTILITDHIVTIITVDSIIIQKIGIAIWTDKETALNHHIEKTHNS